MFYDKLKKACRDKGTSPTAVVISLGMSRGNVTFWKNGQLPSVEVLMKLASKLDVSVDYLLEKEQKKGDTTKNSVAVDRFMSIIDNLSEDGIKEVLWFAESLAGRERSE